MCHVDKRITYGHFALMWDQIEHPDSEEGNSAAAGCLGELNAKPAGNWERPLLNKGFSCDTLWNLNKALDHGEPVNSDWTHGK